MLLRTCTGVAFKSFVDNIYLWCQCQEQHRYVVRSSPFTCVGDVTSRGLYMWMATSLGCTAGSACAVPGVLGSGDTMRMMAITSAPCGLDMPAASTRQPTKNSMQHGSAKPQVRPLGSLVLGGWLKMHRVHLINGRAACMAKGCRCMLLPKRAQSLHSIISSPPPPGGLRGHHCMRVL